MNEIRLHGRGGQGIVVGAQLLASAYILEGKYASVLPSFGVERRGAAVTAFLRFDDKPIRERTAIYTPDCLIVFDPVQIHQPATFAGLKKDSILLLNTSESLKEKLHNNLRSIAMVDGTDIALEEMGVPVPNAIMAGAFAAATGLLSLDSLHICLADFFNGKVLLSNRRCLERGFNEVKSFKY